jgi:hypothetical protein
MNSSIDDGRSLTDLPIRTTGIDPFAIAASSVLKDIAKRVAASGRVKSMGGVVLFNALSCIP